MSAVEVAMTAADLRDGGTVSVRLRYDPGDPLAVFIEFDCGCSASGHEHPVRWPIARDLLADGVADAVGDGDITVGPDVDPYWLLVGVTGPGEGGVKTGADFRLPKYRVVYFLRRTFGLVPRGREVVDVDRFLAECLAGGGL